VVGLPVAQACPCRAAPPPRNVELPTGRRHCGAGGGSKTFRTKREASAHLAEVETSMHRGVYISPDAARVRFDQFTAKCLAGRDVEARTAERTLSTLRAHVLPQWGRWPLTKIDHMAIRQWVTELGRRRARGTVVRCLSTLSMILKTAVLARLLVANPAEGVQVRQSASCGRRHRRSVGRTLLVGFFRQRQTGIGRSSARRRGQVCGGASARAWRGRRWTSIGGSCAWSRSRSRRPPRWC
jgi:Phage integrase central domain